MLRDLKALTVDGVGLKELYINGVPAWVAPPSYTNQVPTSIDTDGSVFNGTGYIMPYRLSSGGVLKEYRKSVATGFIPARGGDIIRIAGVNWAYSNSANYVCAYDSTFTHIGATTSQNTIYGTKIFETISKDGEMGIVKLAALDNIAYIRVSSAGDDSKQEQGSAMIVTINEEIPQ